MTEPAYRQPYRPEPPDRLWREFCEWVVSPDGVAVEQYCLIRAKRAYDRGFRHFGMKAIWEVARYDRSLEVGPDGDGFKLSNNHHAKMARRLMRKYAWMRNTRRTGNGSFFTTKGDPNDWSRGWEAE